MSAAAHAATPDAGDRLDRLRRWAAPLLGRAAADVSVTTLAGDASTRRYHRVEGGADGRSLVVMDLPEDARQPTDEATYPFLNLQRWLAAKGLPVPEVYGVDLPNGFIALEDLGGRTFEAAVRDATPAERGRRYQQAARLIAQLQEAGRQVDPTCLAFGRAFDSKLLRWELDHFREWLLEAARGVRLTNAESAAVSASFDWIASQLAGAERVLVHRDFQSRNLMVVGNEGAPGGDLRVIDFQDALMGPRVYDLVALLRDSYVRLSEGEVTARIGDFAQLTGVTDTEAFARLFWLQTLQRKLKDAGRFVFIDRVRGNPQFLQWIPLSLDYVREALRNLDAPPVVRLAEILAAHLPELR